MDPDPAEHRRRDAARAHAYAGQREPARPTLPDEPLQRVRACRALSHGRHRRSAEGRRLGGGDHRRACRHDPHARARHGRDAHHGDRLVVAAARTSRRAAVLGRDPAGRRARPDRAAGRRLRVRLRLGRRYRRSAADVRAAHDGRHQQSGAHRDSGGAHRRLPVASRRDVRLQRQARHLSRHSSGVLGWRQPVPSPPGHQQAAARVGAAGDDRRARAVVDRDRPPCRHRTAGDDDARAQ